MTTASHYYYKDSTLQLEQNLHNVRRELILLIEEFEKQDCLVCSELKCRCRDKTAPNHNDNKRTRTSYTDVATSNDKDANNKAPPAYSLPKPKFEKEELTLAIIPGASTPEKDVNRDLVAWFETSKAAANAHNEGKTKDTTKLSTLKKAWSNGRLYDLNKEEPASRDEQVSLEARHAHAGGGVEAFFKKFNVQPINMTPANISYITNKLRSAYIQQKAKKTTEYSYF